MLVARLRFYLLPKISPNQYGFMPQRSTEDALYRLVNHIRKVREEKKLAVVVSLDIEGAFDSAWWPAIKVRLAEIGCPGNLRLVISSYLSERRVSVRYAGKEVSRGTDRGCVQGSIGGPILWDLLLDPLLWLLEELNVYVQAFADDIVLVFEGRTALEIEQKANHALEKINKWGRANKLRFAPHKTCALLSTRKLKFDTPRLQMGGVEISYSEEIKILGLIIDSALTFNAHVGNVCQKAIARYKLLARTARVGWGLNPDIIRLIYTAVIEPTILYASAAWAPTVEKMGVQKRLNSVQRGFAQKICKAYRTVSLNSAMLLAGILPLDLRILEAASLYEIKKGVSHPALGDREVERMAPAIEDPHPAGQVELGFGLVDENIYPDVVSTHEHRIYTDGSKIEGRVGAALSVWKGDAETKTVKLALPPYCTVYQAELLALQRAVSLTCKSGMTKVGILSDSRSALQAVTLGSRHPLAVQTREALREAAQQRREVSLFWVKAHAGLRGNERVDQLAKDAALGSKKKPDYDLCPVSFAKRILRKDTIDEWDRRYDTGGTAGVTKLFFPSAAAAYKIVRKIDITHHTTQVLTGHGGFAFYLNRFKLKEDPSCLCQPGVEETVPHLLLECPIFASNRYDIEQKLGTSMTGENLPLFLGGKKREVFLSFCKRVVTVVNKKNCDILSDNGYL